MLTIVVVVVIVSLSPKKGDVLFCEYAHFLNEILKWKEGKKSIGSVQEEDMQTMIDHKLFCKVLAGQLLH